MEARLVQIEGRRRLRATPIAAGETRLGRDPTSEIICDFARVSRHHATVALLGERHTETPEPGDHLVHHQQDPVLVANLAQALEIALRRHQAARGAGNRLDEHGGDS